MQQLLGEESLVSRRRTRRRRRRSPAETVPGNDDEHHHHHGLRIRSRWRNRWGATAIFLVWVVASISWLHHADEALRGGSVRRDDGAPPRKGSPPQHHYSAIHCVGDNFLPGSAWVHRSCQYRNLCYRPGHHNATITPQTFLASPVPASNPWVLYASPDRSDLERRWAEATTTTKFARSSSFFVESRSNNPNSTLGTGTTVSPLGAAPSWIRTRKNAWAPGVVVGSLPPRQHSPAAVEEEHVGILLTILPRHAGSDAEVLWKILWPVHKLLGMFGWNHNDATVRLYPIGDDCGAECREELRARLDALGGGSSRIRLAENDPPSSGFCLRRVAAGFGLAPGRGRSTKDYSTHRIKGAGIGGTLWEFREALLKNHHPTGSAKEANPPPASGTVVWAVADYEQEHDQPPSGTPRNATRIREALGARGVLVVPVPAKTTARIALAARSARAWISRADDDDTVWPALFLPRGSSLVLLYDPDSKPRQQKRREAPPQHPVFADFDLWNHASHLRVHWLAIPRTDEEDQRLVDVLEGILNEEQQQQQQKQQKSSLPGGEASVATFQEHPVALVRRPPPPSRLHCVGHNWEWDAASFRSCLVENLCFDPAGAGRFVRGPSPQPAIVGTHAWSSSWRNAVMMGQSIRIGAGESWFPEKDESSGERASSYYALPEHLVWLPFFAEVPNANNPGHLLWDYFLPLFTLLEMFGQTTGEVVPLLTNLDQQCVPRSPHACYNLTRKFLPLLGVEPSTLASARTARLVTTQPPAEQEPRTGRVCARKGLIGIGMLTDHGFKKHGQLLEDYRNVWNAGRGVAFWRFRNFMVRNIAAGSDRHGQVPELTTTKGSLAAPTYTITFSINSSSNPSRRRDFAEHIESLQSSFPASVLRVETVELGKLPMEEQIRTMESSSIFVSVAGGSASTAMFLKRNSILILFFNDLDDFMKDDKKKFAKTDMPAMLDWDFWNNASYLRVHWLPISSMDSKQDLSLFSALIRQEIESFPLFLD